LIGYDYRDPNRDQFLPAHDRDASGMAAPSAYLDIYCGDEDEHAQFTAQYKTTCELTQKNKDVFGFSTIKPEELDEEQRGMLRDVHVR
jgi:hypothetical protein